MKSVEALSIGDETADYGFVSDVLLSVHNSESVVVVFSDGAMEKFGRGTTLEISPPKKKAADVRAGMVILVDNNIHIIIKHAFERNGRIFLAGAFKGSTAQWYRDVPPEVGFEVVEGSESVGAES